MVVADLDQARRNCNDWVLHSVATGSGGTRAATKLAQSWNARPARADGEAPPTAQQSLQALVDEWTTHWDVVAPTPSQAVVEDAQ
eukprot:1780599-Pyramimonas_sp.AAC.1